MATISFEPIIGFASGLMAANLLIVANAFGLADTFKGSLAGLAGLAARTGLTMRAACISADGCVTLGMLYTQAGVYPNSAPVDRHRTGGGLTPGLRIWAQISHRALDPAIGGQVDRHQLLVEPQSSMMSSMILRGLTCGTTRS